MERRLTPVRVFPDSAALGDAIARRLLERIDQARRAGRPFLLGCPTGRTPRPIYAAMARQLVQSGQDVSHLVLVMMDEYLLPGADGLEYAPASAPWSCHHFVQSEMVGLRGAAAWFPHPSEPPAYDARIAAAGGIDLFLLASGASDGHVAFNPPGSDRLTTTRIVALSEDTRRDNLQTFPSFGDIAVVPRHGISVGIATITSAREAIMVVWGADKRLTLRRMLEAEGYDAAWPATVIHACAVREILCDADAAAGCPA